MSPELLLPPPPLLGSVAVTNIDKTVRAGSISTCCPYSSAKSSVLDIKSPQERLLI
jgi:hypothetical protein